jgi:sigma-B regulation protein RsbU (phosphoserine phosphatase)
LGLAIADVVGKGVAASLMMASVRSSLRAYAFQCRDIRELIRQVNQALCRDTLANEFVTLFYGELDPASLRMRYCNAGHNPPIVLRKNGQFEELSTGGTIVGAFEDAHFIVGDVRLAPGDLVLFYTDGLVDSMNFREERFELDRVRDAMVRFAEQPARQILASIRWEVRKFTGLTPRVDDLTMVALKVG